MISIIIPTYNRKELLRKAILSAQNQTWEVKEIIVVDDASDDGTDVMIRLEFPSVIYFRNKIPLGGSVSRNIGLEKSSGEFIAFLDDDDIWFHEKLEEQMKLILQNENIALVTCSYFEINDNNKNFVRVNEINDYQMLLLRNDLGGASMYLARKKFITEIGGFDSNLKSGQDWDLLLRIYQNGSIVVCKKPLVYYLNHGNKIRITNNILSSYSGLRNIYFKHKKNMTTQTINKLLSELLFYRLKIFKTNYIFSLLKIYYVLSKTNILFKLKFSLRILLYYLKSLS